MYGRRVSKTDLRVAANGAVDELNAALGWVRATLADRFVTEKILAIQRELVTLMGELAVLEHRPRALFRRRILIAIEAAQVDRLTAHVVELEKEHHISYDGWATPGATPGSAALDVARTVCRRAERQIVAVSESGVAVNPEIVRYLNRLSDLCWLWARWVETVAAGPADKA